MSVLRPDAVIRIRPLWFGALFLVLAAWAAVGALPLLAAQPPEPASQAAHQAGGEAALVLPDLSQVDFRGINARTLLTAGIGVCILGLLFGWVIYQNVRNLPVHRSMLEISELIYETCKTYLITQGKFILILELFIGTIIALYFGLLLHFPLTKLAVILLFSLIGIGGSYGVA